VEPIIRVEQLQHTYGVGSLRPVQALRAVNLTIEPGEYVVVLGPNGSGKSTLARHLNGLLLPTQGDVWVKNWNTKTRSHLLDIRSTVGMVFQVPDNQIVATIVEEDVAFGPENLGVPQPELARRIDRALDAVHMTAFRQRAPHRLSGGQKQRICIAGVLAMQPAVIVLDEATAMLDPLGRQEVLETMRRLNHDEGVTIVAITHLIDEAVYADRIIVMADGEIVLEGAPRTVFAQADRLRAFQLAVPQLTEVAQRLHDHWPTFPIDILTVEEMVAALKPRLETSDWRSNDHSAALPPQSPISQSPVSGVPSGPQFQPPLIITENLAHYYMRGTPLEVKAIADIDLTVRPGEILGIIGHTGSGKSTVVQHFNGLLRAHEGRVVVFGQDLKDPQVKLLDIRRRVGLVFQFPESQLFEQYVGDDVAYGPRNFKLSREEVRSRVRTAMETVGLDFDEFKDRLTFSLSGGEKRRVALAGVLALQPEVLVLDEPTAGLDPAGRRQLLDYLLALHRQGVTLVIISHNMEEVAAICDRLYVIADGHTVLEGTPAEVFGQAARLGELGLGVSPVTTLINQLTQTGLLRTSATVYTLEQALSALLSAPA
jgi:energy-coupling factor transport system ATP-binding protein